MTSDADVLFTGAVSTVVVVVSSSMVLGGVLRGGLRCTLSGRTTQLELF